MSTSAYKSPRASRVRVLKTQLVVGLDDGREIRVPLDWFPRLQRAANAARQNFRMIGDGVGIRWPDIDEDLSVSGLLREGQVVDARRVHARIFRSFRHVDAPGLKPRTQQHTRVGPDRPTTRPTPEA